jgi:hypothetical protein
MLRKRKGRSSPGPRSLLREMRQQLKSPASGATHTKDFPPRGKESSPIYFTGMQGITAISAILSKDTIL